MKKDWDRGVDYEHGLRDVFECFSKRFGSCQRYSDRDTRWTFDFDTHRSWDRDLYTKESGGCGSRFRQLACPEVELTDRAIDRLAEVSNGQVGVF